MKIEWILMDVIRNLLIRNKTHFHLNRNRCRSWYRLLAFSFIHTDFMWSGVSVVSEARAWILRVCVCVCGRMTYNSHHHYSPGRLTLSAPCLATPLCRLSRLWNFEVFFFGGETKDTREYTRVTTIEFKRKMLQMYFVYH